MDALKRHIAELDSKVKEGADSAAADSEVLFSSWLCAEQPGIALYLKLIFDARTAMEAVGILPFINKAG